MKKIMMWFCFFAIPVCLIILGVALSEKEREYRVKILQANQLNSHAIADKSVQLIDADVLKNFAQTSNCVVYNRLADEIVSSATVIGQRYSIPPVLILSVIQAESEFNINANSSMKAKGLMQVNLEVWRDTLKKQGIISQESDIYDPVKNIEAGCFILRSFINETHDFEKAMNKYLGVYYKPYIDRIGRNVGNIWMSNISKNINATYRIK